MENTYEKELAELNEQENKLAEGIMALIADMQELKGRCRQNIDRLNKILEGGPSADLAL